MSKTAVDTEPLKWPIAPDGYIPNSVIRSWMRKGKELIKKDCWHDNITSHQSQEVGSTYSSRKTVNFTPTSCHENRPKQLRELREDMKLHETITPPLSVPNKQRTSSFIFNECPATPVASPVVSADTIIPKQECPATPVASPVVSADTIIPKQEPRITSYLPPIELKNLTPHPLKPPPPTPEDPQPQPDLGPPKCLPIRDRSFLLSSPKYSNIINQAQVPLDHKVLQLYKKFKYGNKNSSYKKLSNTAVHPPATHSTIQTKTRGPNLYSGLGTHSAQFAQTICPKDQSGPKSMPEWRKSLYKLISLQGLRSPRATRLAATDHLVKSSDARQLAATIPSLQPGQAATHQRVVQKIQMKDTLEPTPFHFHYVIPKASQHSFVTLNPCGKTMYGRLQFDWMRGSEEDNLLKVSAVKAKICSKSSATLSKRSAQQLASCTISL
ncbi:uncharacterized protein LOC122879486 isoform X9 [Siniperca chuatsi]|uniref:uncharacterized protein LOC122879486 isoform X9 n=1 Tax=Siniperca chuatsi TaxID=119488 RepID=UPI001CE20B18|nr:uncharacterized protein LOC122879486 isoform X9 [Siniperca chuatsi]